jgi:hypothetical protein
VELVRRADGEKADRPAEAVVAELVERIRQERSGVEFGV